MQVSRLPYKLVLLIYLTLIQIHGVNASESSKANALFDEIFDASVARSPIFQGYLGIKDNNDKWDDLSLSFEEETLVFNKAQLAKLSAIDTSKLDKQTLLSFNLLKKELENEIEDHQWRHHTYPVNQMFGTHADIPSFLINNHQVSSQTDAEAYIARLNGVPLVMDQLIEQLEVRKKKKIIPPKFVFPHVIRDSQNLLKGKPFEGKEDSTLLADFKKKVEALKLDKKVETKLISDAQKALVLSVGPGYTKLIDYLGSLEKLADDKAGVWKFPDGEAFYKNALQRTTERR